MARKAIPLKDKELVKQRLARGASTREAIEGTVISSADTASRIAHAESDEIGQIREKYLAEIEKNNADMPERAKLWAKMTKATKIVTSHTEPDYDVPDWSAREKALKYIDTLAGIATETTTKIAIGIGLNKTDYGY